MLTNIRKSKDFPVMQIMFIKITKDQYLRIKNNFCDANNLILCKKQSFHDFCYSFYTNKQLRKLKLN